MNRNFKYIKKSKDNNIKIITYNILAPVTAKGPLHKVACPEKCISWKNRFKLIKKELMSYNADIITLQEVQTDTVYNDIFKYFFSKGYFGYYVPQISPQRGLKYKQFSEDDNFGVMILFKINKFFCMSINTIDYHSLAIDYLKKYKITKFKDKIQRRFANLIIKFKEKNTLKEFYISTVHLESNPYYDDIKNLQAYLLMKHLEKISKGNTIPIILTGDFNSKPSSSAYRGITTGKSFNKFDFEDLEYPKPFINTSTVFTKYPMKSCYKKVFKKEPKYTNYTVKFQDTLDYIFVNSKIEILGALKEINENYLKKVKSIPNEKLPSDHLIQVADLRLR